jgi:hypothetical protein
VDISDRGQQIVQPDLSALMINDLKTGNAEARIVAGKSRNEDRKSVV